MDEDRALLDLARDLADRAERAAKEVKSKGATAKDRSYAHNIETYNRILSQARQKYPRSGLLAALPGWIEPVQKWHKGPAGFLSEEEVAKHTEVTDLSRRLVMVLEAITGAYPDDKAVPQILSEEGPTEGEDTKMRDLFIAHASEDKEAVARPLANALSQKGLKVWYDEFTLTLGDSLRRSIDHGLAQSRYGVVILSPDFFAKEWPQRELDGLVAREVTTGEKVILPVWHNITREEVARFSPTLADRYAASTKEGMDTVVAKIMQVVRPGIEPEAETKSWIKDIQLVTPQLDKLQDLHRQNISGSSVPNKPSRLSLVIGPKDAHLAIRMTESLDNAFRTLVQSQFSNLSGGERRDSNHIRLYLTLRFKAPHKTELLTPVQEREPCWISFDRDATLLFTDYIQRVQYPNYNFPVLVRSLEEMALDMYRIFTIAEQLYSQVAKYGGRLYVGLSLTNLWGTALQDLVPPPQQARIATWHTEVELSPDSTKGNAIFDALSSLLRDLQYPQSEQPVREALAKLDIK